MTGGASRRWGVLVPALVVGVLAFPGSPAGGEPAHETFWLGPVSVRPGDQPRLAITNISRKPQPAMITFFDQDGTAVEQESLMIPPGATRFAGSSSSTSGNPTGLSSRVMMGGCCPGEMLAVLSLTNMGGGTPTWRQLPPDLTPEELRSGGPRTYAFPFVDLHPELGLRLNILNVGDDPATVRAFLVDEMGDVMTGRLIVDIPPNGTGAASWSGMTDGARLVVRGPAGTRYIPLGEIFDLATGGTLGRLDAKGGDVSLEAEMS